MGIVVAGGSWSACDPNLFASFYLSFSAVAFGLLWCMCGRPVKKSSVSLTGCAVGLVLLLCYLYLWDFRPEIMREVCTFVLVFVAGMTVAAKPLLRRGLCTALAGWAVLMTCLGLLQQCGLFTGAGETFPVKGVFDNPAGLGMFLALLFPYMLERGRASRVRRWMAVFVGIVLVLSGSRTGILAAAVSAYVYFYPSLSRRWRIVLPVAGIVLFVGLYFCKPVSANGRMFVAYITSRLAVAHLLTGSGPFGFEAGYMQAQATYFAAHPASPWLYVADDIKQPFNEYLHFLVRFGLVGLCWFLLALCVVYRRAVRAFDADKRPALASIVAVSVCACFSYPFYYPLVCLLVVLDLAVLCSGHQQAGGHSCRTIWLVGFLMLCLSALSVFQLSWERARLDLERRAGQGEQTESLRRAYEELSGLSYFRIHPAFLYNHALHLYECGHYAACLSALERCRPYKCDYDWQMLRAYALLHVDEREAEASFRSASRMLPSRLQPRYELVRLYDRMGKRDDALRCAREAMDIPVKVGTLRTEYMRRWLMEYAEMN